MSSLNHNQWKILMVGVGLVGLFVVLLVVVSNQEPSTATEDVQVAYSDRLRGLELVEASTDWYDCMWNGYRSVADRDYLYLNRHDTASILWYTAVCDRMFPQEMVTP